MSALLISLGLQAVSCAIWFFIGRSVGQNKERKAAEPFRRFATPAFRALRVADAQRVLIVLTRKAPGEWSGEYVTEVENPAEVAS